MLASAMTIKTPPPGYKVPGSGSEAVRGPVASAATAVQVGKHRGTCPALMHSASAGVNMRIDTPDSVNYKQKYPNTWYGRGSKANGGTIVYRRTTWTPTLP